MSSLQKSVLRSALGAYALPPRNPASGGFGRNRMPKDFSPIHWSTYFEKKNIVDVKNGNKFCVYAMSVETPPQVPVIVLLHGGGFSALSWASVSKILDTYISAQIIAIDLRGHGESATSNEDDLSANTMSDDILEVIRELKLEDNPIILVGHSLGGALAVHTAEKIFAGQEFNVTALVIIDVVEGSAMESLSTMHAVLKQRPKSFPTLTRAIEWAMKSGIIKCIESARVSMPGQLKFQSSNEPATVHVHSPNNEVKNSSNSSSSTEESITKVDVQPIKSGLRSDSIQEEEDEEGDALLRDGFSAPLPPVPVIDKVLEGYTWRIDLHKTEPFWEGWFKGMSTKFLSLPCPKLLMLAGVDRLDRDLTVGQMQGKFQMHVISNVGHAVHEDSPDDVAESISSFLVRHKLVEAKKYFQPVLPGC